MLNDWFLDDQRQHIRNILHYKKYIIRQRIKYDIKTLTS